MSTQGTGRDIACFSDGAHARRFGLRSLVKSFIALLLVAVSAVSANAACKTVNPVTVVLPDPASGRRYEIYISLPDSYAANPSKSYPLLILADGGRAFPKLSCDVRALAKSGAIGEEPVVVGLSYAIGEDLEDSRRRDYTPVADGPTSRVYGGAAAYQTYLRNVVLRHIEHHYRTDPARRLFWGHSYGGLLGAHILLTEPALFQTYLIGSPSFWFANQAIYGFEEAYAKRNKQLDATVILYVGGLEVTRYDPSRKGNTRDMVAGVQTFVSRLSGHGYSGLQLRSSVIPGTDHRSSVRPGFAWALTQALALHAVAGR
ncbi:alpha/beta hydrolase [Brucella tritici]|uniref:alpha/beta hydrolase n=1 Tax=Brucella tritici TaxID=94626 RepID=UPI00178C3C75|nr:alpha/beta hydrolase-fold protein [Brucella tritici]